ncbi:unnamed protein product [Rotaria sp. Silwood1]|nr:unnamed protein product [Rotaria sp. Silwood1]
MLCNKFYRYSFQLSSFVRYQTNIANDNQNSKPSTEKKVHDQYLSNITVTSFYCQTAIEQFALKQSTRLSPLTMMYIGKTEDGGHLLRSAQYLHKDLPIRFAHRINDFRNLPFVVACNPLLLELHERFIKIFHTLHSFPSIKTLEHEKHFTELLQNTLTCSSDTLPLLAEGFRKSKQHIKQEMFVRNFLDRALTSRLAIKMLIEHHIELRNDKPNHIGVICMSFSPKKLIEASAEYAQEVCRATYGIAPDVTIDGHVNSSFPYITTPLSYIVPEMLKNAFRVRDRGGGMPGSLLNKIHDYHFSSNNVSNESSLLSYTDFDNHLYDQLTKRNSQHRMSGYGFGVPTSRAYCEYLNGSLTFETMYGIGTDVYIRVGLLTSENRIVRL